MLSKPISTALLVAAALLFPLAVFAEPQVIPNQYEDAKKTAGSNMRASLVGSLTELAKTADDGRFTSSKPLGLYYAGHNVRFKSDYAKQTTTTIAEFAYDLDASKAKAGCSFTSYVDALKQGTSKQEALNKTHLAYDKQKEFARAWWLKGSPAFAKTASPDLWLHESILDATYLFGKWRQKMGDKNKEWLDKELDTLANRR